MPSLKMLFKNQFCLFCRKNSFVSSHRQMATKTPFLDLVKTIFKKVQCITDYRTENVAFAIRDLYSHLKFLTRQFVDVDNLRLQTRRYAEVECTPAPTQHAWFLSYLLALQTKCAECLQANTMTRYRPTFYWDAPFDLRWSPVSISVNWKNDIERYYLNLQSRDTIRKAWHETRAKAGLQESVLKLPPIIVYKFHKLLNDTYDQQCRKVENFILRFGRDVPLYYDDNGCRVRERVSCFVRYQKQRLDDSSPCAKGLWAKANLDHD